MFKLCILFLSVLLAGSGKKVNLHHASCMELLPVEFVIGDFLKCEFIRFEVQGRGGQGESNYGISQSSTEITRCAGV